MSLSFRKLQQFTRYLSQMQFSYGTEIFILQLNASLLEQNSRCSRSAHFLSSFGKTLQVHISYKLKSVKIILQISCTGFHSMSVWSSGKLYNLLWNCLKGILMLLYFHRQAIAILLLRYLFFEYLSFGIVTSPSSSKVQ